jgi:hypothetical protein
MIIAHQKIPDWFILFNGREPSHIIEKMVVILIVVHCTHFPDQHPPLSLLAIKTVHHSGRQADALAW